MLYEDQCKNGLQPGLEPADRKTIFQALRIVHMNLGGESCGETEDMERRKRWE